MKAKDIHSNTPRNIRNNFIKNNTFNYDSFALENKNNDTYGETFFRLKKDIKWISIKLRMRSENIPYFQSTIFWGISLKKMDIPRNIPLYLVLMKWNYYKLAGIPGVAWEWNFLKYYHLPQLRALGCPAVTPWQKKPTLEPKVPTCQISKWSVL